MKKLTEDQMQEVMEHLRKPDVAVVNKPEEVIDENPLKKVIEYDIPINDKKDCERMNKSLGTNFRSTEEHIQELFKLFGKALEDVSEEGGCYMGDGIKVKIEIEYDPENK